MNVDYEVVRIKVNVEVNLVGGQWEETIEFPLDYWESLTEEEQEQEIKEFATDLSGYSYSYDVETTNDS